MTDTKKTTPLQVFENARLGKKNFKGALNQWGDDRGRTFRIYFTEDPDRAEELRSRGYNIQGGDPIDGQEGEFYPEYLEVSVMFGQYPPEIWITNGTIDDQPRALSEETVASLDSYRFASADVVVRGNSWKVGPKSGIKAYLKKIYVSIDKDAVNQGQMLNKDGY